MDAQPEPLTRAWAEVQALGLRAAMGAGVPHAQALAFSAALARHVADDGADAPVLAALDDARTILTLAQGVETLIETASVGGGAHSVPVSPALRALMVSWIKSLPCDARVDASGAEVKAALTLTAPSQATRPARLTVSQTLHDRLSELAERTYVPDSDASRTLGAGAGLMDTD